MDNMKHRRLQELDRSDFEIVDGEPDIRGWDVKLASGQKIGEVEELIVDAKQKKVRYMVVDLDDNDIALDQDRKVLIPIGLAELHHKDDDVIIPSVQVEQLRGLPAYDKDHLDEDVERNICSAFGRTQETMNTAQGSTTHQDFYQHDYYNDDNLYKHRLHETFTKKNSESEYEKGLNLWEKRSEGGIIEDERRERRNNREENYEDMPEEARMEMVRNRRSSYEQKRYQDDDGRSQTRGKSIEDRIRDEGLRDA